MSQVPRWSEVCNIKGAISTPGYLPALLQELAHVPRALTSSKKDIVFYATAARKKRSLRDKQSLKTEVPST